MVQWFSITDAMDVFVVFYKFMARVSFLFQSDITIIYLQSFRVFGRGRIKSLPMLSRSPVGGNNVLCGSSCDRNPWLWHNSVILLREWL